MFLTLCEEEKCEENWAIILRNAEMISFNFDMQSSVYARPKIYKFGRNWLSSFGDMEG